MTSRGYGPAPRTMGAARRVLSVGRNPLRRRTDRVESVAVVAMLLTLVAAMLIGWALGARAASQEQRAVDRQSADGGRVVAVLDETAPTSGAVAPGVATATDVPVKARWHTPDGTRTGLVRAAPGTTAGSHVPVWLGPDGQPTDNPATALTVYSRGIMVGMSVPLTVGLIELLVCHAVRRRWQRARMIAWGDEWERVEPIWKSRWRNV
ncbi:MAG: hypothetical protein WCA46_01685 [Actinocatenispora sp.]